MLFLFMVLILPMVSAEQYATVQDVQNSQNIIVQEIHEIDGKTTKMFEDTQIQINSAIVTMKEGAIEEIGKQVTKIIITIVGIFFFCLSAFMLFISMITIKKYNYFTQSVDEYVKNNLENVIDEGKMIKNETNKHNLKKRVFKGKNKSRMVKKE